MKHLVSLLKTSGFWIEVSGRPAEILIDSGCRYASEKTVARIFPDSEINWLGDGIYTRTLPDGSITEQEYLVGLPTF